MKGFVKRIAFILVLIMSFENVFADISIDESPSVEEAVVENITDAEHSEEEVESTSEEIEIPDEVVSAGSVIVNLLDLIKSFRADTVPDAVVSASAVDYDVKEDELPKSVKGLLSEKYNKISNIEKSLLNDYLYVRDDTMTVCADNGLNIEKSVPFALIMQIMNIDFDAARSVVIFNQSETKAVNEALAFSELYSSYGAFKENSLKDMFTEYALVGYTAEEVFNAYRISLLVERDLGEVIYDKNEIKFKRSKEDSIYFEIAEKYSVKSDVIAEYVNKGGNIEEIENQIEEITEMLKDADNSVVTLADSYDYNFDVGYDASFKEGPLGYVNGINDSIDPSTGVLSYSENICSLPGKNGLDLNLSLTYSSSSPNTAKDVDEAFNIASNWKFNVPYLTDKDGKKIEDSEKDKVKYITLESGATYEVIAKGSKFIFKNCTDSSFNTGDDVFQNDVNHSGGQNSVFLLKYKNGNTQYFDKNGRWIKTKNRFGNTITVIRNSNVEVKITDTLGRVVTINTSNGREQQTVTTPDGKTTTLKYNIVQNGSYKKRVLAVKTDAVGNNTNFTYTVSTDDLCKNALLTKIVFPTGLENYYEYQWTEMVTGAFKWRYKGNVLVTEDNGVYEKKENINKSINNSKNDTDDTDKKDNTANDNDKKNDTDKRGEDVEEGLSWELYIENVTKKEDNCSNKNIKYARILKSYTINDGIKCNIKNYSYDSSFMYATGNFDVICAHLIFEEVPGKKDIYKIVPVNSCDVYYIHSSKENGKWECVKDGNKHIQLNKPLPPYTYTTTITDEKGVIQRYTFNQLGQNTNIWINDGDGESKETTIEYLYDNAPTNLPTKITYREYSGTKGYDRYTEEISYTDNFDVREDKIGRLSDEFSDVYYEYDYDLNDTGYGIPLVTTTKMDKNTDIVQESLLGLSDRAIRQTVVRRGEKEESRITYQYNTDDGRITSSKRMANNSEYIQAQYTYGGNYSKPTEVNMVSTLGGSSSSYTTAYTYDGAENIISVKDANNNLTEYQYNDIYDIVGVVNRGENEQSSVSISYNYKDNQIIATDGNGKKVFYDFDPVGNKKSVVSLADGITSKNNIVLEEYSYDTSLRPIVAINGKAKTVYKYDNFDRVISTVVYDKDDSQQLLSSEHTYYEIGGYGTIEDKSISIDRFVESRTRTQYDALGRKMYTKVYNCSYEDTTNYSYDMLNNLVSEYGLYYKQYEYDSKGNVLKTVMAGDSSKVSSKDAIINTATYDMLGNKMSETDGNGNTATYTYTGLNWLKSVENPIDDNMTGKVIYSYDRVGNKIGESIKNNTNSYRTTTYQYDYKNRLSQVYNSAEMTRYTYDKADNILSVTRGLSNNTQVTSYKYDNRNQLIKYTDAMGQPETYVYDNYGNMVSKTDRNGDIMKYTYDALGNCLSEEGKDVNNTFTYNLLGNVKTASNGNVQQSFTYNDMGLLKKENTVINGTTFLAENFYKEFGVLSAETYEKNNKRYSAVEYTTDIYGRQISAEYEEGINVVLNAEYTYDKNSNITEIKDNNMTRKYEYNKANLITGVTNINNKNVKTSYRYSYYPDGNIAHYVNHYNATMDYTYDSANRVVKEVYDENANMPFTIGYTYDEFGNLTKKDYRDADNPSYITTYSYDKNNRLIKENQVVSNGNAKWQNITSYGYDKNGNRLNRVEYKNKNVDSNKFNLGMIDVGSNSRGTGYKYSDYGKEVYTYDGLNELKSYRGKNEQNATYEYMPNHYRISKTVDGTKTYQLWDNDRVVSEFDSELNMKINYRIGTNGQVLSDSKENSYSYDGHGNLVNGKDNSSTTVYDAYGNKTEDIGIGDAPFGYCGEYTDLSSGLIYLRNRYYDPSIGRFISEDPVKNGLNWYIYCSNNPINRIDPFGLFDYNTRLSYSQTYNEDVEVLQNELAWLGYLDMSGGGWGYFGSKTQDAVNRYKNNMGLGNTGKDAGVVGLQTWTSLGLIYRTKEDIAAGVEIVMVKNIGAGGRKQYKDFSVPINNALNNAVGDFQAHSGDFMWFYDMVKTGATWDIKLKDKWNALIGAGTYPGSISASIVLFGTLTTPEAVGNITYGYLGTAAGFSEGILLKGGDFAAAGGNLSLTGLFNGIGGVFRSADSADDKANVRIGINWYNNR